MLDVMIDQGGEVLRFTGSGEVNLRDLTMDMACFFISDSLKPLWCQVSEIRSDDQIQYGRPRPGVIEVSGALTLRVFHILGMEAIVCLENANGDKEVVRMSAVAPLQRRRLKAVKQQKVACGAA